MRPHHLVGRPLAAALLALVAAATGAAQSPRPQTYANPIPTSPAAVARRALL